MSNLDHVPIVVPHPLNNFTDALMSFTMAMPPAGRIEAAERGERAAAGPCWSQGARGDAVSKALRTLQFSSEWANATQA